MRRLFICIIIILLFGIVGFNIQYTKWKPFWSPANRQPFYNIPLMKSDTLRVLMIGDSWAGFHHLSQMDSFLQMKLEHCLHHPVIVISKGFGGEKSKGIYLQMFDEKESGTKSLLLSGCDYCIISAGINDAAANLGTKQFCTNYYMILDFLLTNDIRPVILEVPDVDIWTVYKDKPKKDLLVDYIRSIMTHCGMYNYSEYRDALFKMLQDRNMIHRVVYVHMRDWNGEETSINKLLFMKDGVHLNKRGYEKLDSCIAFCIEQDLNNVMNPTFINNPMGNNTQDGRQYDEKNGK